MSIITPYLYMLRSECLRLMLGTVTFKERAFVAFSSLITILIALLFCHKTWLLNQNLYTRPPYFQRTDTDNKTIWKAEMMTAEKFKEYFNIWSNLLIEGLDMLSREENLELVHVQDVFEHILQSKRELEAGLRGSLRATDAAVSRMRAELGGAAEDLEVHNFGQPVCLFETRGLRCVGIFLDERSRGDVTESAPPSLLQRTRAGQEKLRRALCDVRVTFEKALQELEVSTSLVLKENVTAVSQLQHALQRKSEDMEKQHAVQKRREVEIRDVRVAFEKAVLELESNASCVLRENELMLSQLQGTPSGKSEDLEDLQNFLVETAREELTLPQHELKMEDHRSEGHNLTTTLEGKGPELPHKVELQGLRRHGEEMLQARDHLCKEATESRKYPETDAEKERWREQPGGESGGAKSFGEEAETAEEGLRKTPALLHSVSQTPDQDWDHCATWWQILEGKETAKAGRRQKEEQAKMLRAKIHLKVKNGPCQIQLL
ncbi:uncharacterized protein LOC118228788 isoform X5 [Anguilla anguilla]|uniref:uncharacterized protein LOC118228788 isoform X5 n=1 Tax=Anguilla anguilla TaxID=7936 RepID=UPI0015A7606B|nr:uncharacterized protein LOC118228788 isoform X5 [Anguilla anguilla]